LAVFGVGATLTVGAPAIKTGEGETGVVQTISGHHVFKPFILMALW